MTTPLPRFAASGLLLLPDPHVAATPPGQRLEGFADQILAKIEAALVFGEKNDLLPFFLGDLFNWPRENPNSLLVRLIDLFRPRRPFVLVGNHDKYQARYTDDVSLAVLAAAGVVRVVAEPGPLFHLDAPTGSALVGASPDGAPLPARLDRPPGEETIWLTHHNIGFPDFLDRQVRIREIEGLDWVVNGHLHRPQPTQTAGGTRWVNPGNMTRLTFTRRTRERVPAAHVWRPGNTVLERFEPPCLPFEQVFPDQDFPPEVPAGEGTASAFVSGLERLAWRRTREGLGLKEFLLANLSPESPESELIWDLYKEAVDGRDEDRRPG